jgi:Flp pilus assembly protein TadG
MNNFKDNLMAIKKELQRLMSKVEQLGRALEKAGKSAISSKTVTKKDVKKAVAKKAPVKKKAAAKKAPARKTTSNQKVDSKEDANSSTAIETVVGIIQKSKSGVDVETLISKTGYDAKKISNLVYKAKKRGDIKSGAKGIYVKK